MEMQTDVVPRRSMRIVMGAAGRLARTQGMTEKSVVPKHKMLRPKSAACQPGKMQRDQRTTAAFLNPPLTRMANV